MSTRIYLVTDVQTNKPRLILAGNQAQAIRHAAQTRFDIEVAGQDDLVSLLSHGIPVELAGGPATADMFEEAKDQGGSMNDQTIEQEIQAKGKTAPRITPDDIEANIAAEYFFTAEQAVAGASMDQVAEVAHEVNKCYCHALGDNSQPSWADAPEWQRSSARMGAELHTQGNFGPEASHISWMRQKLDEGWKYGPVKCPEKKEHPCIVPFDQLPVEQQAKDYIFRGVVHAVNGVFSGAPVLASLGLLTFCVLVLKNGFTVTGESACASPENFDADIGRKIARQNAVEKIWPLMGYALKSELATIDDNDFQLGKACDLSGEGTCEACQ